MNEDHQYAPAIPGFYDFSSRPPAVKSESIRSYITPTNGASFALSTQMTFELPCGTPRQMLDPNIFHGSNQLSSISEYNLLQQFLTDFGCGADDYKTTGTMKGVADYTVSGALTTAASFSDAYYARLGATIAPGGFLTVCVPLITIWSLAMRAWPISQAKENIRIVIKLTDVLNYGKWSASPVGSIVLDNARILISAKNGRRSWGRDLYQRGRGFQLPIFVAIRKTANLGALGVFNRDRFTGGDVNREYHHTIVKRNGGCRVTHGADEGSRDAAQREHIPYLCERRRISEYRIRDRDESWYDLNVGDSARCVRSDEKINDRHSRATHAVRKGSSECKRKSHYMPFAEPGRSFDLTSPHDKEWLRWLGAPGDEYKAIANILKNLRTTVDGLWCTFERGTGKVQVVIGRGRGATVAGVDNTRRFRDAHTHEKLYQLPYTGQTYQLFYAHPDWAENVSLGEGIFGPRHQQSKALMEKVQAKYGPAHAIGQSWRAFGRVLGIKGANSDGRQSCRRTRSGQSVKPE
ncbi:hypothetical protein T492DRAFT_839866 [Pavlovales sp. CCMP2436]|nr:hypothetical protein T492DRAFT_839866 [Pavlovales sp. CCMP2436]